MSKNQWMQTYTGIAFDPFNPNIDLISIEDIAHALSNLCRFGGHSIKFYSVAEHSWLVSRYCPEYPLAALLHDATEAYIGDIIRPLKQSLPNINTLEDDLQQIISRKFSIPYPLPPEVKEIDFRILGNEKLECMKQGLDWYYVGEPLQELKFNFWLPVTAKQTFLLEFKRLIDNE